MEIDNGLSHGAKLDGNAGRVSTWGKAQRAAHARSGVVVPLVTRDNAAKRDGAAADGWSKTLHLWFKASRVRAVFAGRDQAYGPTREFGGIGYFLTGGGGARV